MALLRATPLLSMALGALLVSCGSEEASAPSAKPSPAPSAKATTATGTREPSGPAHADTVQPPPVEQPVAFVAADGTRLAASLWAPRDGAELAVLLVHQLGSDRGEWRPFVEALLRRRPRPVVLALDLRGHGESTGGGQGKLQWRRFTRDDWERLPADVMAALDFLASRSELRTPRTVVVGSSIGGSAAFLAALHDRPYKDPRIDAVGWLSPGRAYHGLDVLSPAARYGRRPFAAFVARGEVPAVETAEALARVLPRATVRRYPGDAHGVAMLKEAPALLQDVVAFVEDPEGFVAGGGGGRP